VATVRVATLTLPPLLCCWLSCRWLLWLLLVVLAFARLLPFAAAAAVVISGCTCYCFWPSCSTRSHLAEGGLLLLLPLALAALPQLLL
jgi:hypothetical protein